MHQLLLLCFFNILELSWFFQTMLDLNLSPKPCKQYACFTLTNESSYRVKCPKSCVSVIYLIIHGSYSWIMKELKCKLFYASNIIWPLLQTFLGIQYPWLFVFVCVWPCMTLVNVAILSLKLRPKLVNSLRALDSFAWRPNSRHFFSSFVNEFILFIQVWHGSFRWSVS